MADAGARYTHGHHDSVLRSHRWRTADNSAAYLLGRLRPGMDLLDVGCGPGTVTVGLAAAVAPGRVLGIDAAADVVGQAAELASGGGIEFAVADVAALDLPDSSFDVVHAHQLLQHLADPVAALREMARVCRPDGTVAVRDADYGAMTWWPPNPGLESWRDLYRQVARANGGEPDAGRRLLGWAAAAGLDDVEPGASAWCFATPDDRGWWAGSWAERIVSSGVATRAVELGWASRADLEAMADAWRDWAAAPDGWFVVVHGEVLARPGRRRRRR